MQIFIFVALALWRRQWRETEGSETPASLTFSSQFLPPSVGVPATLFYFYCKMLHNIAKIFSFSPGFHHFGNSASHPLSSHLLYHSWPLFSWAPAPCPSLRDRAVGAWGKSRWRKLGTRLAN